MPIYEYRCPGCEARFSLMGNMDEASNDKPCPNCGSVSPRVMSRFNSRKVVPFRIMQEDSEHPGQYVERAFSPDYEVFARGDSREYWDGVDKIADAELIEKVDKEAVEVAMGNREPPKGKFKRHFPHMFPKGAPMKGLDPS